MNDKRGNAYEVKIVEDTEEAAYYARNNVPYIIHLNDTNRNQQLPSGAYCVEDLKDVDAQYCERVYRRFKGLPWDITETQRLKIREITVADVPRLYELYQDKSITQYMEPLFPEPEQEAAYTRDYIKNIYGFYGYGMWAVVEKQSKQVIGRAGFEYREGTDGLEVGFMLGVEYQHKGYAYEAGCAVLSYGVDCLQQEDYCAFVNEKNTTSKRLCERLGFRRRETIRRGEMNAKGIMVEKEFIHYHYSAK